MSNLLKSNLIIEDDEYYYFFRSLNSGDRDDLARNITTVLDVDGKAVVDNQGRTIISKVRTDRQRLEDKREEWVERPKYEIETESSYTLEEVFDHIKMRQRKDTNCISLSANSNVTFTYYANENPQYVVIKARKDNINVFDAGIYMFDEISSRTEMIIEGIQNPFVLDLIKRIQNAKSIDEIKEIVQQNDEEIIRVKRENEYGEYGKRRFDRGILSEILYLSDEQNLELLKVIARLEILREHEMLEEIIPDSYTTLDNVIATMKTAIASSEFIHYGEISRENVERISTQNLQAIAILQQYKDMKLEHGNEVDKIIAAILDKNQKGENIIDPLENYSEIQGLSIEEIYNLTDSDIPYVEAKEQIETFINLARARKDASKIISQMEQEFGSNEMFEEMKKICILPNPQLVRKQNLGGIRICESIYLESNLDINQLKEIVKYIQNLSDDELEKMAEGDMKRVITSPDNMPVNQRVLEQKQSTKINKYYAEAIYDLYDWTGIGRLLGISEKNKIIKAIVLPKHELIRGNGLERVYKALEEEGYTPEEIPGIIINIAINNQFGEINYTNLVKSDNPREIIRKNSENINSIVSLIDIELLLGKDRLIAQILKRIGVKEEFTDKKSELYKESHNLYWAKRIVEGIDWKKEIGRNLEQEEIAMFIESIVDYKRIGKTRALPFLYKNLMLAGLSQEEACRFIVIGSVDSNYPISNLLGHREITKEFVKQNLEYYKNRRVEKWDIDKAKIVHKVKNDSDGKDIKDRLIKLGFNPEFIEIQRTDNLYWTEFLVDNMDFSRQLSTEEKVSMMEQILDLTFLSKDGACKLVTTCETIREMFNLPVEKIGDLLINITINGAKAGLGYKKLISTQEYWQQLEKEELNTEINEATLLEVRILKKIRENKERDFYKQQLLDLGVDEKRMENSLTKDLIWTLGLFNSINFEDRLSRSLEPMERKIILESLLGRKLDGTTIQGIYEKLNNLGVENIPEVLVNASLGYSGVNGFNYSQGDSQDEMKKVLQGNYDKLNTKVTDIILRKKTNEVLIDEDNYIEELKRIGVKKDFFEEGNPNQKKKRNVYWINKIVDDYNWDKYFGRPIEESEKAFLVERLLMPVIMNTNMEVYIGNAINYMIEKEVDSEKICGYITKLALYSSKVKGLSYTTFFSNKKNIDLFLKNTSEYDYIIDEECLKKAKLEVEMENDSDGTKVYERMRKLGIRDDFLDEGSEERRYYKVFYFIERIMQEYNFKERLGRELTAEEKVAVIEKLANIGVFSEAKAHNRLDTTFDIIRKLDLKGKDPLGVMLFIGFERIDTGKIKDQSMYYGKIVISEPTARKIEDYIDDIGDTITEKTLREEVIRSRMNRKSEVEKVYEFYQKIGINPEFITKGNKNEKSLENLFVAKKIFDDCDFEKTLGRLLSLEEERLILEMLLENSCWNVSRKISMFKLYNNISDMGLNESQIAGLFINLIMSKRKGMTFSQLVDDKEATEKLNSIRDELKYEVDEQTLADLKKERLLKEKAKKVVRQSVDPKRNAKGRKALSELEKVVEAGKDGTKNVQ